jgi:hypothetical protein
MITIIHHFEKKNYNHHSDNENSYVVQQPPNMTDYIEIIHDDNEAPINIIVLCVDDDETMLKYSKHNFLMESTFNYASMMQT